MKQFFITTLALFICVISYAQTKHTITVKFIGMKSDKGDLYVALYNNATDFLKKPIQSKIEAVKNLKANTTFTVPKGVYAISVFHDENENKKMDTRFFGMPKEPVGISNDAKGFMGPPKYKDAKFKVTTNLTITINIK